MSKPIKDIELYNALNEIEEILRRDGWCKGEFHSPTGEHCLAGVVEIVTNGAEREELWKRLTLTLSRGLSSLTPFNDNPHTTFADVLNRIKSVREALLGHEVDNGNAEARRA